MRHLLVGVKFKGDKTPPQTPHRPERPLEFCKMLRLASLEKRVFLYEMTDEACPTAQVVLGFKEPKFFEINPRVKPAETRSVLVAPVGGMEEEPDVIHAVLTPRQMMDLTVLLGSSGYPPLNVEFKGERACSDFTARPFMEKRPNVSFLCTGARTFADFRDNELIFGATPEVFYKMAETALEFSKKGGALCGCRTSDIPQEIVEGFEKIGLSKGIDYFFGRMSNFNVRVYLDKDPRGRLAKLTLHIPLRVKGEEKAKETAERLASLLPKAYSARARGPWIDFTSTSTLDEASLDLQSEEKTAEALRGMVGGLESYINRAKEEGA